MCWLLCRESSLPRARCLTARLHGIVSDESCLAQHGRLSLSALAAGKLNQNWGNGAVARGELGLVLRGDGDGDAEKPKESGRAAETRGLAGAPRTKARTAQRGRASASRRGEVSSGKPHGTAVSVRFSRPAAAYRCGTAVSASISAINSLSDAAGGSWNAASLHSGP